VKLVQIRTNSGKTEREFLIAGTYRAFGAMRYSPDGQEIAIAASSSTSEVVLLLDAHVGTILRSLDASATGICSLAFDPTGRFLLQAQ
jgi:hypothetical protein